MAIGRVIYFSGTTELKNVYGMIKAKYLEKFPGVAGKRYDSFAMLVGYPLTGNGDVMPVTRIIEYKRFPSKHVCDARCQCATGKVCECSCGGKYHGAGKQQLTLI